MLGDLVMAKDKVESILKQHPETRDCDKTLWLAYLVKFCGLREKMGDHAYLAFKAILLSDTTCTMESITRCRRKFQEDGFYQGEHRKIRMKEAENVRDHMRAGG